MSAGLLSLLFVIVVVVVVALVVVVIGRRGGRRNGRGDHRCCRASVFGSIIVGVFAHK